MNLREATDRLGAVLARAQEERPVRPDLVPSGGGMECEWAAFEREAMHQEVNRLRQEQKLPQVAAEEIRRRESWAVGHSDYSRKLALYCAELALATPGHENRR